MTRSFVKSVLIGGFFALIGAGTLAAQNRAEVAQIPFAFQTQQKTFAPGKYRVAERNTYGLFQLYSEDGHSILISAISQNDSNPTKPHLTFTCYARTCALSEISMPGSATAYRLSKSQLDKELPHKLGLAAMISVPLKAH